MGCTSVSYVIINTRTATQLGIYILVSFLLALVKLFYDEVTAVRLLEQSCVLLWEHK